MGSTSWKLVATGVAALAVVGAGGAVAATGLGTPQEESKAVLDDVAKQLGVDEAELLELNPHLIKEMTPPGREWQVRVPIAEAEKLA